MSPRMAKRPAVPGLVVYARGARWAYRLELGRHPLTDERDFEYRSGFATEEDAWTAGVKAKANHGSGRAVRPSRRTVAAFLDEWLAAKKHAIKPSTYTNYVDYRDAYVLPSIGRRKLQDVDVPMLNALYVHLLSDGRRKRDTNAAMYKFWSRRRAEGKEPMPREIADACDVSIYAARSAVLRYRRGRIPVPAGPGLAPKTVKNVHRMLHLALGDAVAWRYVEYNPAIHASLPRERRRGRRKTGATWTPEQLAAWLKIAVEDRDAGMWVLAATSGMRRSELAGADRRRLDLAEATLDIEDTRVVVGGEATDSDGKSDAGVRTISLDPLTVVYLSRHLEMLDEERQAFGRSYDRSGKLFCHPDGRPIHPETITRRFNRMVDRAGVPHIRLHDVRHTYATVSLDAGVDPKIVSDRIGHSNMAYTLAIYTHRSTGRDREAAEQVAKVIFGEHWRPPSGHPNQG